MRLDMNIFQIAAKYAANLMGIATPEEREALENWNQESVWHTNLAERLDQEEDFKANQQLLERFSVTEAWKKMEKNLDKAMGRRAGERRWWKYAAVILVMLGGGFWYFQMKTAVPVKPPLIVQQSIPSGKRSAKLTLGNGKVVKLVPNGRFTLAEMDGTVIQKDSTGIDYRQIGVGEDTLVYNQMETLTGMEYTLTLSDGTRVYLNAESRLKYPVVFRGTERVVELSGEAYFKVSKDALRPFVVKMNGVNVRVLGTSFNVRSYADEGQVVTTLVEGKVKVNDQDIVAGEQAVYSKNDGKTTVRQVEVEQYVAWQEGTFVFRNERLENVMKTLGRWYGVEFHFIDERAKEIRIGARFGRYDDMQPIVDMIKKTNLVEVLQTNRCLYISEKTAKQNQKKTSVSPQIKF